MTEDDIKAKQDYLYKEIIEQNYDPEEFQEYILTIKGLSLQLYTLSELISVVEAFKKGEKYSQQRQEEPHLPQSDPSFFQHSQLSKEVHSKIHQDCLQNSELKIEGNSNHLYESSNSSNNIYHEFLLKETLSHIYSKIYQKKEKIHVKIRSYSKVQQGSFFGSTYVCYLIQTPEMGWSVRRRFNDFEWLQAKISQILPGYPVPPIPKKTAMRSFNDHHLQQRMNTFERYLNRLLSIPEICSQLLFESFLSIANQQQFNNSKQKFDASLKSRGNKLITLKGQNVIDKSEYKLELTEFQFYKRSEQLVHHLNTQIINLQSLLKQTTTKAFQVSSIFNALYTHLSSKNIRASNVTEVIGDFVSQLGYKLEKEHSFISKEVKNYWNYEEKYLENIVAYMSKVNKQHYQMLNKYKSMSNFEVDSDQQTKNKTSQKKVFMEYQQAREIYRVKLSFLRSEIVRYQQNDFVTVAKQWINGLQSYMMGVRQLMISGVDQLTKAECVAEGKKLVQVQYIGKKGGGGDGKKFQ